MILYQYNYNLNIYFSEDLRLQEDQGRDSVRVNFSDVKGSKSSATKTPSGFDCRLSDTLTCNF